MMLVTVTIHFLMLGQARRMEVFQAHEQHSKMVISSPILINL
jgi:hypothetical protein